VEAILVGVNTVLKDDPELTVRLKDGNQQPIKVILDSHLRTPPSARIFSSKDPVLIATTQAASKQRERNLRLAGAEIVRLSSRGGRVDFRSLLRKLAQREISHLLIEGGGEVIAAALKAKAVDRIACIVAPMVIGGRDASTAVEGVGVDSLHRAISLRHFYIRRLGPDLLVIADIQE